MLIFQIIKTKYEHPVVKGVESIKRDRVKYRRHCYKLFLFPTDSRKFWMIRINQTHRRRRLDSRLPILPAFVCEPLYANTPRPLQTLFTCSKRLRDCILILHKWDLFVENLVLYVSLRGLCSSVGHELVYK